MVISIIIGMAILLLLILRAKLPALIALLIASIITGILSGIAPEKIMETVKAGMASTIGYIAVVVGLGSIFGGILQHTRSAESLATWLLAMVKEKYTSLALMLLGFLVSVSIFFDVGLIILFPVIAGLVQKTGKNIIQFALPLTAGLAVSHAFIPPTPGPLAVAEIIGANIGYILLVGTIAGLPAAYISGVIYGRWLSQKMPVTPPSNLTLADDDIRFIPSIRRVLPIMLLPIVMIVLHTMFETKLLSLGSTLATHYALMIFHPFSALLISCLAAWYFLGRSNGLSSEKLNEITSKSLYPAGMIILVTGAGGVFKQILVDTGAGKVIAEQLQSIGFPIIIFAFVAATIIRVLQGSATVAMITAAGLCAPIVATASLSEIQLAAIVISISSGATMFSHINDSGFWIVKQYFGLDERQGIRMWTVGSTILGLVGFCGAVLVYYVMG